MSPPPQSGPAAAHRHRRWRVLPTLPGAGRPAALHARPERRGRRLIRTVAGQHAGSLAVLAALAVWLPGPAGAIGAAAPWPAGGGGPARAAAGARLPAGSILHPGLRGPAVLALQRRLARLHYYPGPLNGRFGTDTLEAVWAFKEVQGLQTATGRDDVGPAMQRALASPRLPRVLVPRGGELRIEVSLAREVLVLYRHDRVALISHVSAGGGYYYPCPGGGTCGPAITPDGNYRAHWFASGWLHVPLGLMYNPIFFIGASFAIHGDSSIPLRPASHGCVRIPVDIASFLHNRIRIGRPGGTPIYIRGHAPGTWPVPQPTGRTSRPGNPGQHEPASLAAGDRA
jgi:Putative peptidoglycan binding domain/L,D-transpeptidase catalytic domain